MQGDSPQPDRLRRVRRYRRRRRAAARRRNFLEPHQQAIRRALAGQQIEAEVIKIDPEKKRIAISMKQLQPHPWDAVAGKYKAGERVRGTVTRVMDFGAFVELEPGIEGLIHISEMSWAKKSQNRQRRCETRRDRRGRDPGVNPAERRISLGLKQALGDPWADVAEKFAAGTVIEGPVTSLTKFGAFVQLAEGVEGMIHVSEISAEKRINHPQEVLKVGQIVKAQVLAIDHRKAPHPAEHEATGAHRT